MLPKRGSQRGPGRKGMSPRDRCRRGEEPLSRREKNLRGPRGRPRRRFLDIEKKGTPKKAKNIFSYWLPGLFIKGRRRWERVHGVERGGHGPGGHGRHRR